MPTRIIDADGHELDINSDGSIDVNTGTAAALADGTTNPTVTSSGAYAFVWNGTTWDRMPGNTTGSFVQGPVAHDSASTARPIIIGSVASAAEPTAVTAADVVRPYYDTTGYQYVKLGAGSAAIGSVTVTSTPAADASTDDIQAALFPYAAGNGLTIGPATASNTKMISAATTNATCITSGATKLYFVYAHNTNANVRYLKFYDMASTPTVGTHTPRLVFPIPGSTAGNGFMFNNEIGIKFSTGLALALTASVADSDTTAVEANAVVVNIGYAT